MKTLAIERDEHVVTVFLNRPEQSNSLLLDTFEELNLVGEQLAADDSVRVVILTGRGKNFCAGLDMSLFPSEEGCPGWFTEIADIERDEAGANVFQRSVTIWRDLPVPVIAAVNGAALGGGFQIALGADIRLADASTRMSIMETHWGLVPDVALSRTLPSLAAQDVAAELMLSARIFDAKEAKAAGMVTRIGDDCFADAMALATNIAGKSPDAIRATKKLYSSAWQSPGLFRLEVELQKALLGSANQIEAARANIEKRSPNFC